MNSLRHKLIVRLPAVVLLLIACTALANHCALGGMERSKSAGIHGCCGESPVLPDKAPVTMTECCKALQIVSLAAKATVPQAKLTSIADFVAESGAIFNDEDSVREYWFIHLRPPRARSFAEQVLQQSQPSHAPPAA